jgi:hypothetical protein
MVTECSDCRLRSNHISFIFSYSALLEYVSLTRICSHQTFEYVLGLGYYFQYIRQYGQLDPMLQKAILASFYFSLSRDVE